MARILLSFLNVMPVGITHIRKLLISSLDVVKDRVAQLYKMTKAEGLTFMIKHLKIKRS